MGGNSLQFSLDDLGDFDAGTVAAPLDKGLTMDSADGSASRVGGDSLIDAMQDLNRIQLGQLGDPEIATHIENYELAYRMQAEATEAVDIDRESAATNRYMGRLCLPVRASLKCTATTILL